MEIRNAKKNSFGGIDCEVNHLEYGWIPITLNKDDPETSYLFERVLEFTAEYSESESALAYAKREKIDHINKVCTELIIGGFSSQALGEIHFYRWTLEDQTNFQATWLQSKEFSISRVFRCTDANGVVDYRFHTFAQLTEVAQAADAHKMQCLMKAHSLKTQIDAAKTIAEVEAVVW